MRRIVYSFGLAIVYRGVLLLALGFSRDEGVRSYGMKKRENARSHSPYIFIKMFESQARGLSGLYLFISMSERNPVVRRNSALNGQVAQLKGA